MAQDISTFKSNVSRKIHGTSLNKVEGINDLIAEAGGNVIARLDPAETIREVQITNGLFDDIFDYTAPADLKGKKVIDIRRQVNRQLSDRFSQSLTEEFDLNKLIIDNRFQVRNNNGTKSLRINKQLTSPLILHTMDDLTSNGTWAATSDAINLTRDTVQKIKGSASLNFDLDGLTTSGFIENSTMTQTDLTTHDEQSSLFINLFVPDTSAFTSVDLRWGNDTSNFFNVTATTTHDGTSVQTGFNIFRFDWNGATETGTVDPALIDYLRVTINYDGVSDTDYRVDQIISALPEIFLLDYYSKFVFTDSTGVTFKETPTTDSDLIVLDTETINIMLYEALYLIAQQLQGEDASFDSEYFKRELHGEGDKTGLYKIYKQSNPSEQIKPRSQYYKTPPRTYGLGTTGVTSKN